jgi:hypothetical protein
MKIFTIVAILLLVLTACEGPAGPEGPMGPEGPPGTGQEQDKLLRIPFSGVGFGNSDTTASISSADIYRFSKLDYVDVDSIKFVTKLYLYYGYSSVTEGAMAEVQLYNRTDSVLIENSLIQSTSTDPIWLESGDIYPYMPDDRIDLTIWIRSSIKEVRADCRDPYLYIYRR